MRVNISYSVDLDNIPDEVEKLLSEAENIIENDVLSLLGDAKEEITITKNYSETVEKIDDARVSLIKTVARLEDCSNILLGFSEVLIYILQLISLYTSNVSFGMMRVNA